MKKILANVWKLLAEHLVIIVIFVGVITAFKIMQQQQEDEMLKALQSVERIKLKWAMIKE
ncbi:hypothetical protein [Paraglaciecola aestuariivivens]